MRIIHLIDYFQPKLGYQEYFLAKEHLNLGHHVFVVTSDRYFPIRSYENTYQKLLGGRLLHKGERQEEGIKTVRLSSWEIPGTNLVILKGLKKTLHRLKPDLVLCHGVYSLTSFLIALYKNNIGFSLIYDTHAASFNTNLTNTFPKKFYRFLFQKIAVPQILHNTNAIFAVGEEEQKFLSREFNIDKKLIPIIRLGVDIQRFIFNKLDREKVRKIEGFDKNDVVIIYSGKITKNKDIHILIEAIKMLHNQKVHLLILGGGENSYLKRLKEQSSKIRITWHPFVKNAKLSQFYCASDIGVWPGDFSITILEAMACGLPVILPFWKGSLFLDKSEGVIRFTRGNIDKLRVCINDLISKKYLRDMMGRCSEKFIKNNLSWDIIAGQTLNLINSQ